jgi:hypothetical protein
MSPTTTTLLQLHPAAVAAAIAGIFALLAFSNFVLYGKCCPGCGGTREHRDDCPFHERDT